MIMNATDIEPLIGASQALCLKHRQFKTAHSFGYK